MLRTDTNATQRLWYRVDARVSGQLDTIDMQHASVNITDRSLQKQHTSKGFRLQDSNKDDADQQLLTHIACNCTSF
jgi:hypothetical protein